MRPSWKARTSKLDASGRAYSSRTLARKPSGSLSCSRTNARVCAPSLDSRTESGMRHSSANLRLKLTIRPCRSTTRMPSAVDSNVALRTERVARSSCSVRSDWRSGGTGLGACVVIAGPQYSPGGHAGATPRSGRERDAGHASGCPSGRLVRGRLVQDQPVEAQLADRFSEFSEVDRLTHVAVRAEAVAADEIALLLGRREDHHREQLGTRIGT